MCKKNQGSSVPTSNLAKMLQHQVADVPPFVNTSVDFTRTFYVKNADQTTKAYVYLFTCVTTCVVHLELTNTLGVPQFIQAFRRFVSHRGLP